MSYAIVTAAIYVLAIAFLYAPKCPGAAAPAVDPTAPIVTGKQNGRASGRERV